MREAKRAIEVVEEARHKGENLGLATIVVLLGTMCMSVGESKESTT